MSSTKGGRYQKHEKYDQGNMNKVSKMVSRHEKCNVIMKEIWYQNDGVSLMIFSNIGFWQLFLKTVNNSNF